MVRQAERELGGIDILVNNAGVQFVAGIAEFPPEQWERIIAINLSAAFHAMRAAIPLMQRKAGAASSTRFRRTDWSPVGRKRRMWRPSTA